MMRKLFPLVLLLLPVLILLPFVNDFAFRIGNDFSDIPVTHFPNGIFLQNTLRDWKDIPAWSPLILSGYPFYANPLSGLHYPLGWLALLFKLPLGFNLVVIFHIIIGGIGMFLFLREEGHIFSAALLGGLIFEAMPKMYGHFGAGHLTLIYAMCWTPWLMFAERRVRFTKFSWVFPGIILGNIALADIRWCAYCGIFWVFYSFRMTICDSCKKEKKYWGWYGYLRRFGKIVSNTLIALLIAAPLLLPLAKYVSLSSRAYLSQSDNVVLSLPPAQFLWLLFPNIGSPAEWVVYPGCVVILLMLYAVSIPSLRKQVIFWISTIALTWCLSMGSYLPIVSSLFGFPLFNLLRVPPRLLFISGFCLCVVAASAYQHLCEKRNQDQRKDFSGLVLFAVAAFAIFMALGVAMLVKQDLVKIQFAWGAAALGMGFLIIRLLRLKIISTQVFRVAIHVICLIDLIGINSLSLTFKPFDEVLAEGSEVIEYLGKNNPHEKYRVYSPSYSLPQQTTAYYGVELADGVDPMQILAYTDFMETASGVPVRGYSVTIPSFDTGDPALDNQRYTPDPIRLGQLNVKYVVSAFPLLNSQMPLIAQIDEVYVYENSDFMPRAWMQVSADKLDQSIRDVEHLEIQPDRIIVEAEGPGVLILSEINFPGWEVTVDQASGRIETVEGIFRSVRLGEGRHTVIFLFRPYLLWLGLVLAGMAYLVCFLIGLVRWKINDRAM